MTVKLVYGDVNVLIGQCAHCLSARLHKTTVCTSKRLASRQDCAGVMVAHDRLASTNCFISLLIVQYLVVEGPKNMNFWTKNL